MAFKGESFVPHGPAESEPDGLIVLGIGDDCGQHQDLLVNLDLKVPAFANDSPAWRKWWWKIRLFVRLRGRVSVSTANRAILCKITVYSDSEHPMDTPKPLQKSAHLLDDLESIRQLLGDDNLQPPLLTDTVDDVTRNRFHAVRRRRASPPPVEPTPPPGTCRRNPRRPPAKAPTPCCTWTANCAPLRN